MSIQFNDQSPSNSSILDDIKNKSKSMLAWHQQTSTSSGNNQQNEQLKKSYDEWVKDDINNFEKLSKADKPQALEYMRENYQLTTEYSGRMKALNSELAGQISESVHIEKEHLVSNKKPIGNGFTASYIEQHDKPVNPDEILKKLKNNDQEDIPLAQQVLDNMSYNTNKDGSVTYLIDKDPAFTDHGSYLTMEKDKSDDEKAILGAMLFAKEKYHGSFELTGTEEFKRKSIEFIVKHNLDVTLKNPAQDAYRNELLKKQANEKQSANADNKNKDSTPVEKSEKNKTETYTVSHINSNGVQQYFKEDAGWTPVLDESRVFDSKEKALETIKALQDLTGGQYKVESSSTNNKPNSVISDIIDHSANSQLDEVPGEPSRLVNHGAAPYKFNSKEKASYYLQTQSNSGDIKTVWGVDLKRAISESNANIGENIDVKNLGKQPVTVEKPVYDNFGKQIDTEQIQTHRNSWELNVAEGKQQLLSGKHKFEDGTEASLNLYKAENGELEGFLTRGNLAYSIKAYPEVVENNRTVFKLVNINGDEKKEIGYGNAVNKRNDEKEVHYDQMIFRIGSTVMMTTLEGKIDESVHEKLGFKQPQRERKEAQNNGIKVKNYKKDETIEKKPVKEYQHAQSSKNKPKPRAARP